MRGKIWIIGLLFLPVLGDLVPVDAQDLIDAVHVPAQLVPPTGPTMRDPLYPGGSLPVDFYLGVQPVGAMDAGDLHYRVDGGAWLSIPMVFFATIEEADYWVGSFTVPSVGYVEYYLEARGPEYLTTYVYGEDNHSFTTGDEPVAQGNPFEFTIGVSPTPTPTAPGTETPLPTPTTPPSTTPTAPVTMTPMPPTTTPAAPTDTPAAPTMTPGMTDTPQHSTATPTVPVPPTETATPSASPTPAFEYEVDLVLSHEVFYGGEQFTLWDLLWNRTETVLDMNLFVILEVYGMYWFWPEWSEGISYYSTGLNPTSTTPATYVILDFPWTDVQSSGYASFLSAMISPDLTEMLSNLDVEHFEWY
ncbi:hypothetical protein JXA40_05385 [bacterium]|nr:hypothetical protein [candidate division CSSED10-310 bacterium]